MPSSPHIVIIGNQLVRWFDAACHATYHGNIPGDGNGSSVYTRLNHRHYHRRSCLLAMGAEMLSAHLFVYYFTVLAGVITFICVKPLLLNSFLVRIAIVLIVAGVLYRPFWVKFKASR